MNTELKYSRKNIFGTVTCELPVSIGAVCKGKIDFGFMSYIGKNSEIYGHASIGRFCSIAADVVIGPTNHPLDTLTSHLISFRNNGPFANSETFKGWVGGKVLENNKLSTVVGNDVWIGRNVTIIRGIKIGSGAVIAAGSVVTKDVAPYAIVGGVPAKLIRMRFSEEIIRRLLVLKWWNYDISKFDGLDLGESITVDFLNTLEYYISSGEKLTPQVVKINNEGEIVAG